MKIAIVSSARSSDTVKLVNGLVKHGHQVALYSMPEHVNIHNNLDRRVTVHYLPKSGFWGYFQNAKCLREMLAVFHPDIVNAHYAGGYGTLARLSEAYPLALTVWSGDVCHCGRGHALYKKLVLKNLNQANAVFCANDDTVEKLRHDFLFEGPVTVTPFGVDCRKFVPYGNYRPSDRVRVGAVRSLEEKGGVEQLIRGFALFDKKMGRAVDTSLEIYGSGRKKAELQELIDLLELTGKVKLMGGIKRSQLPEIMNRMDIFCALTTPRQEVSITTALEAMACGVPVVETDRYGITDAVVDGETGYVVRQNDITEFANKLYEMAWNRGLCQDFSRAGRNRVLARYNLEKNMRQIELLYGRTINQSKMALQS